MKLITLKESFTKTLIAVYEADEVRSFFAILAEFYLGLLPVEIVLQRDKVLSELQINDFEKAKQRLLNQEPIQYIVGTTEFYGLPFMVNENVLIPRPETEELVDWILESHLVAKGDDVKTSDGIEHKQHKTDNSKPITILDIGTGSGCIAIALAKHLPQAKVYAMDVSSKALKVAKANAVTNQVTVHFLEDDILTLDSLIFDFDVIVSNPPYVRELEKKEIKSNVLENEPHLALFVSDDDPLVFYRKIIRLAGQKIQPSGSLFFEINQYLSIEMEELMQKEGLKNIELKKDIYGNCRMIRGEFH